MWLGRHDNIVLVGIVFHTHTNTKGNVYKSWISHPKLSVTWLQLLWIMMLLFISFDWTLLAMQWKCPEIKYPVQWVIIGNDGWQMVYRLSSFNQVEEKSKLSRAETSSQKMHNKRIYETCKSANLYVCANLVGSMV